MATKKFISTTDYAVPSVHVFCVAGIKTKVYGLDELPSDVTDVACVWLLHLKTDHGWMMDYGFRI